jgi:Pentapeptide repeats (9 copies)
MSPQVAAAIIAAGVGVLTVIATVSVQIAGRRATSRDTQKALEEQRKQLDRTLAEQRTRTLNERFATAAGQLGSDKPPAVRLAGVYAMAGLADDWPENRQTCVDVLCAYLRLPYDPRSGDDVTPAERAAYRAGREVRRTVIRVITAHLREDAAVPWQGLNFDFTGVVFDGGDFSGAEFSGGTALFGGVIFSGGIVDFSGVKFSGGTIDFGRAEFSGGEVRFRDATFSGGEVRFYDATFSGGEVRFARATFSGGTVGFGLTNFSGGMVHFTSATFSGGTVGFSPAKFSGGAVDFTGALFSGGEVHFARATFSGGRVDFGGASWSVPPVFPWTDTPPPGVKLPRTEDQSQT